MSVYGLVPRSFQGETVICLGTGPSLTQEDVTFCRGKARVIAIKDAISFAPWCDVLYSCGSDSGKWWQRHGDVLCDYPGLRYTLDPTASKWATVLNNTGEIGIETDPTGLRTGRNSGAQAIGIAVHLGAKRIVLLGYDLQPSEDDRDHFFGAHPLKNRPPFAAFMPFFDALVEPLRALGIEILNATRRSALECFKKVSLEEALV